MEKKLFENNLETKMECPECGEKLLVKTNHLTENQFLGCRNYPECRYTRPIPREWILRAEGQPELF